MSANTASNKRSTIVRVVVAVGAALSWITTAALLPVIVATAPLDRGPLIAFEGWLSAVAVATSVWAAILHLVQMRTRYFELGYIACCLDLRTPTVVSIATHARDLVSANGDRRDSNKVS